MSGARVELEFDNAAVLSAIRGALAELTDPRPMLLDIGEALVNSTRDRFSAQRGPDGQTWKSLSPRYLETKSPNPGKILQRRGDLVRQIFPQVEGATLLVGTDRVYGAVHQFGALKGAFGKTRRGAPSPGATFRRGRSSVSPMMTQRRSSPSPAITCRPVCRAENRKPPQRPVEAF